MAGEIFGAVMEQVEPAMKGKQASTVGKIVIGTVQGDIHDIGKNIVRTMLKCSGFEVHDLGVDVPPERIVEKLKETGARLLGLSALLTTSFDSMKATVEAVKQAGLRDRVKVMVGGHYGHVGKVERVETRSAKVYVSGIETAKRDGSKAVPPIHPSNLLITELVLGDKKREAMLARTKK